MTENVFRHRRLADFDPEFQQFAMDTQGAPPRIRRRHAPNHGSDVGRDRRSPDPATTLPTPEQRKARRCQAITVSGFDDDESLAPLVPDTG